MTFGDNLDDVIAAGIRGAMKGLAYGAEHLLAAATVTVPIEEGTLSRSGKTSTDEAALKAAVSYNTPYAVAQHEDLSFAHDEGRTAKWLENAANSEADRIGEIVAAQATQAMKAARG